MKLILTACTLFAMGTAAFAQTEPNATDPETPAIATPDDTNPTAPVAGENSFTEDQAKARIEEEGYANVLDLKLGEDGIWRGKADKSGAPVEVAVDYQGNVTEGTK